LFLETFANSGIDWKQLKTIGNRVRRFPSVFVRMVSVAAALCNHPWLCLPCASNPCRQRLSSQAFADCELQKPVPRGKGGTWKRRTKAHDTLVTDHRVIHRDGQPTFHMPNRADRLQGEEHAPGPPRQPDAPFWMATLIGWAWAWSLVRIWCHDSCVSKRVVEAPPPVWSRLSCGLVGTSRRARSKQKPHQWYHRRLSVWKSSKESHSRYSR